jgi:hypothetical protein
MGNGGEKQNQKNRKEKKRKGTREKGKRRGQAGDIEPLGFWICRRWRRYRGNEHKVEKKNQNRGVHICCNQSMRVAGIRQMEEGWI